MAGKNDEKEYGIPGKNYKKKKYSHNYYDKVVPNIQNRICLNKNDDRFKDAKLNRWQKTAFKQYIYISLDLCINYYI